MKFFKSINHFLIKYEFLVLMTLAALMHFGERHYSIGGLGNAGTLFFLIAIVSFSIKKFIGKNN